MSPELQNQLYEKYPKIFVEKDLPMTQTCMCWGIEVGDGWYTLIDNLCGVLQYSTDSNNHPQIVASQVKEKLGGLRFYTNDDDEYQRGIISFAETMAESTCENCGSPAKQRSNRGWISTLCANCLSGRTNEVLENELIKLTDMINIGRSYQSLQEEANSIKLKLKE